MPNHKTGEFVSPVRKNGWLRELARPGSLESQRYSIKNLCVSARTLPSLESHSWDYLSLLLRVLGHHLDKKAADDFMISWSTKWVRVVYGNREETLTLLDLY
jgi:hypothetical protein